MRLRKDTNVLFLILMVIGLVIVMNQITGRSVADSVAEYVPVPDATMPEQIDSPQTITQQPTEDSSINANQQDSSGMNQQPQPMRFPCNQRLHVASPNTVPGTADQIYPAISLDKRVYQPPIRDVFIMRSVPVVFNNPPIFLDALSLGPGGMPPPRRTVRVSTETQNMGIVGISPTAFDQGVIYTKTPGRSLLNAELWWAGTGPDAVFGSTDDIPPRQVAPNFIGEMRGAFFPGLMFQKKSSDLDGDAIIYITQTTSAMYYSLGEDAIPGTGDERRVPIVLQGTQITRVIDVGVSTLGFAAMLRYHPMSAAGDKIIYHDNGPDRAVYNGDDQERGFTPTGDNYFIQMDASQDSGHLAWTEGEPVMQIWPHYLWVYNPGPDERMGGNDDQVNLVSSGPVHYDPSITRQLLVYLTGDRLSPNPIPDTIHFLQPGPDGYYGTNDDIAQSIPLGQVVYDWLSLQSVGNGKFAVWADRTNGITMYYPC